MSANLVHAPASFSSVPLQAILTFNHQVVFDPVSRKAVHRTPLRRDQFPPMVQEIWWPNEDNLPCLPFLGSLMDDALAQGIADGLVDPCSKVGIDVDACSSHRDMALTRRGVGGSSSRAIERTRTGRL